jgi:hypothetical protein
MFDVWKESTWTLCQSRRSVAVGYDMTPNNLLQRSVNHKVLGRGRSGGVLKQVMRARVLERSRAVAEQGR